MTSSLVLLDARTVINLFATRCMRKLVRSIPGVVAIADVVANESQFVRRGGTGEDANEREQLDLRELIAAGLLTVLSTDDEEELLTYLDFTLEVDSGEAMTAAMAIHRNAAVVTDDRKAVRLLRARSVHVISTLEIVHSWCEQTGASMRSQRQLLVDVRERARYEPRRNHPYRPWWDATLHGGR